MDNPEDLYPPALASDISTIKAALEGGTTGWLRESAAGDLGIGPPLGPAALTVRRSNGTLLIGGNTHVGGSGSRTLRVHRGTTAQQAGLALGTGTTVRWALQMRGDASEDLYLRNEPADVNALRIESRAGQVNITLLGGSKSYGGGAGVIFVRNASVVPSSNPVGGGLLFVHEGALKFRGSNGTVTVIGPA